VVEVSFLSGHDHLLGSGLHEPSKAVASRRLLVVVLLAVLRKLRGRGGGDERLTEPLASTCLCIVGEGMLFL
ncbi:unnamed protein product, partial [Choristocarpus tenellus]